MEYSNQIVVSDGTLQLVSLTFPYIDEVDVHVSVDFGDGPEEYAPGTIWDWVGSEAIRFNDPLPVGAVAQLQRQTEIGDILNKFTLGAMFNAPTLDENFDQLLYIAQEYSDVREAAGKSLRVPSTEAPVAALPGRSGRAGKLVAFDSAGEPEVRKDVRDWAVRASPEDAELVELPAAEDRANKVLAFDSAGQPTAEFPATDSATELRMDLANPDKGAAVVGFLQAGVGAVTRTVRDKLGEIPLSPFDFGAKGDGVTDDTAAFQATFDAARAQKRSVGLQGGPFLLAGAATLYLDGDVSVRGLGLPTLLMANGETKGANKISIAIGVRERWQGEIRGIRFVEAVGYSSDLLINVFNAANYEISDNQFLDFTVSTMIKGINDSNWGAVAYHRAGGRYRNNYIRCVPTEATVQQEGISVSSAGSATTDYLAEDFEISGNVIVGCADDPIAFHGVRRGKISGNTVRTLDGRIFISDSEDFVVTGNHCEHVSTAPVASASLIQCTWESSNANVARGCSNFTISGNTLKVGVNEANNVQAIYVQGGRDFTITSNTVNSVSLFEGRISVASITHLAVLRPSGNFTVAGNVIKGGSIILTGALSGPAKVEGNLIDGKGTFGNLISAVPSSGRQFLSVGSNQLTGAVGRVQEVAGDLMSESRLLAKFSITELGTATKTSILAGTTFASWKPPRGFVITEVTTRTSVNITGGFFRVLVYLDGVLWVHDDQLFTFNMSGVSTWQKHLVRVGEAAADRYLTRHLLSATDVRLDLRGLDTSLCDAEVEIYGYFLEG